MSATCASCRRTTPVLVTLTSPKGEYQLCRGCLGRDLEPRKRVPTEIPPRNRRTK